MKPSVVFGTVPLIAGGANAFVLSMGSDSRGRDMIVSGSRLSSRRSFVSQAGLVTSAATMGFSVNIGHGQSCLCEACRYQKSHAVNDGVPCRCIACLRTGPDAAHAYERDVGADGRSPETYAQNIQAH